MKTKTVVRSLDWTEVETTGSVDPIGAGLDPRTDYVEWGYIYI